MTITHAFGLTGYFQFDRAAKALSNVSHFYFSLFGSLQTIGPDTKPFVIWRVRQRFRRGHHECDGKRGAACADGDRYLVRPEEVEGASGQHRAKKAACSACRVQTSDDAAG